MDGGSGGSAIPVYQNFVELSNVIDPLYTSMIIPARWYSGGRGLEEFREVMITDRHIRKLHDFTNAADCFYSGVEIKGGICYFLKDRNYEGDCTIFSHDRQKAREQKARPLKEEDSDVFIRYEEGVSIYHKTRALRESSFENCVSAQRPFGLRTYIHGQPEPFINSVKIYERGGTGYINATEITQNRAWVDLPKVYVSAAYGASDSFPHQIIGKPIVGERNSCCTETYVVIGPYNDERTASNVASYMRTRFFRFLVMLKKTSQHAAAGAYAFVPVQDFSRPWTDAELYAKYGLSSDEIAFVENMIRPME